MSTSPFTIKPRILAHFGDGLIRNEIIALTELVKNSYDANAENCTVKFFFDESDQSNYKPFKIVIWDDGDGMTREDIVNYWLTVGTDHKKHEVVASTLGKRIPLGEKGIGRFGVHKLGEKIFIKTKTEHTAPLSFNIDWTKLKHSQSFDDFNVNIEENKAPFSRPKGLTYRIENIKGEWSKTKLRNIYRALTALNVEFSQSDCNLKENTKVQKLIQFANKSNTSDQFRVKIKSEGNSTVFKNLKTFNEIKESACYECDMFLSGNQILDFQYYFHPLGKLEEKFDEKSITIIDLQANERLLQREAEQFSENEPQEGNTPEGLFKKSEVIELPQKEIGDIYIKLYAFEKTATIKRETGLGRDVDDYLRESAGIRVYRNGMRVYDYGEKGNDWLGLSSTSNIGKQLRNEHVVGYVFLDRKNSGKLIEKTNREGFIENYEYFLFTDALKWAIKHTFLNYRNIDKDILSSYYSKTAEPVIALLKETQDYIEKYIENKKHKAVLTKHIYTIEKEYKEIVDTLYLSAGLGLLSTSVVHEIEKLIKELNNQISCAPASDKVKMLVRRLNSTIKRFSFLIKKTDKKKHNIESVYEQALLFVELRVLHHSITLTMDSDTNSKCIASMNHATNVLLNIFDNSIYWINNTRKKNKLIRVYITDQYSDGYVTILIADNGPGFPANPKYLMKPFVSTKPYSIGSGLGLYIAHELMEGMQGSLSFPDFDDVSEFLDDTLASGAIIALNFKKAN
ncbi:sensor histidine kinase [Desulfovibrio inopinatus]|uniref:sensor histidine kinase n=1 Tax=Desulfovibrio inopinatus TaxID=102109 RepID=UPI00041801C9|nr:sensor histidine kinase [Desulfovibrio inopinatus]